VWWSGSACAGLLLGLAELAISAREGKVVPPLLALALLASCTASVALAGGIAGAVLRRLDLEQRPSHSTFVGAVVGPLLAVALGALSWLLPGGARALWLVYSLETGILAGLLTALVASRAERAGRPASALATWAGAALLLAEIARMAHTGGEPWRWSALPTLLLGTGLGTAGLLGLTPRGSRGPRTTFGSALAILLMGAVAGAFAPRLIPWLLLDRNLPETGPWPPNFVLVTLEAVDEDPPAGALLPTLRLFGTRAFEYETEEPVARALLATPEGSLLAPRLEATGYATAAILTMEGALTVGASHVEQEPGGRRRLREDAAWMAGAPLLIELGAPLLTLLGEDRILRSPEQVGAAAARWLLRWRVTRAPAPFFLVVDFRAPGAQADAIDAGLATILDRLDDMALSEDTLLAVAIGEPRARVTAGSGLRVVLVPPATWRRPPRTDPLPPIRGGELGSALLRIATSRVGAPVSLPGLAEPFVVPAATR
jgi:hypothetical protein